MEGKQTSSAVKKILDSITVLVPTIRFYDSDVAIAIRGLRTLSTCEHSTSLVLHLLKNCSVENLSTNREQALLEEKMQAMAILYSLAPYCEDENIVIAAKSFAEKYKEVQKHTNSILIKGIPKLSNILSYLAQLQTIYPTYQPGKILAPPSLNLHECVFTLAQDLCTYTVQNQLLNTQTNQLNIIFGTASHDPDNEGIMKIITESILATFKEQITFEVERPAHNNGRFSVIRKNSNYK